MHSEAFAFVKQFATTDLVTVIEIGSRDINGSVRSLFPNSTWTGLDLYPGPAVDWVGNAVDYTPQDTVDIVMCCEVLEHSDQWEKLITHAAWWLKPEGRMIITCAGPGREPHSLVDGCQLRPGEYYGNVSAESLRSVLVEAGLTPVICAELGHDTQAIAISYP